MIFVYTDKIDDDSVLCKLAMAVLNESYALLRNTITDTIHPLMKCFVEENIFSVKEQNEIADISSASDKITMLLSNIFSSLNKNNARGFYKMLKTMKEHGGKGTQSLADLIMNRLKAADTKSFCIGDNDDHVQNDDPKC